MKNWIRSWFEAVEGYGDDPRAYDPTLDYRPLPRTTSDPQKGRETWRKDVTILHPKDVRDLVGSDTPRIFIVSINDDEPRMIDVPGDECV